MTTNQGPPSRFIQPTTETMMSQADAGSSSRNNLFSTNWSPQAPAAHASDDQPLTRPSSRPAEDTLRRHRRPVSSSSTSIFGAAASSSSSLLAADDQVPHTSHHTAHEQYASYPASERSIGSPRTASFFDTSTDPSPVPAPRLEPPLNPLVPHSHSAGQSKPPSLSPSPLNLSREPSLRRHPPPPLSIYSPGPPPSSFREPNNSNPSRDRESTANTSQHNPTDDVSAEDTLSPLHRSPSLVSATGVGSATSTWQPPLPPTTQSVDLRFFAHERYLLGEGRYGKVYLASYRERSARLRRGSDVPSPSPSDAGAGSWRLCAAKLMAGDRDSQTMGLREAFFLNRLTGQWSNKPNGSRSLSPLSHTAEGTDELDPRKGRVYVIKLIAVKEEIERRPSSTSSSSTGTTSKSSVIGEGSSTSGHTRSSSLITKSKPLSRKRSSTFGITLDEAMRQRDESSGGLSSFPSLPELAQSLKDPTPPSSSRLVLLLDHAPLGTLDRFLRTSPSLVGKELWERWAREGTEALHWIHHRGVVHADVKPGNLLLTTDFHIRLSDFGSSLLIHASQPPTDGLGLGTLPFSPPELIDPTRSFSFPVDIFALGATLYQCLTGREPYRGVRTMEMMHHVRRGGLWTWEERARIGRIGEEDLSISPSPYPSAWRGAKQNETIRRGGSLRVPRDSSPGAATMGLRPGRIRPRLGRMPSAESIQASEELLESSNESPAGVKLWARWMTRPSTPSTEAMSALLSETPLNPADGISVKQGPYRSSSTPRSSLDTHSSPVLPHSPHAFSPNTVGGQLKESPDQVDRFPERPLSSPLIAYEDGSPMMTFLDGAEYVNDAVRQVIRQMVQPDPAARPTALDVRRMWRDLRVGVESTEEEQGVE